jgi:hypothetical protein
MRSTSSGSRPGTWWIVAAEEADGLSPEFESGYIVLNSEEIDFGGIVSFFRERDGTEEQ